MFGLVCVGVIHSHGIPLRPKRGNQGRSKIAALLQTVSPWPPSTRHAHTRSSCSGSANNTRVVQTQLGPTCLSAGSKNLEVGEQTQR